jgi:hypothetical protein
MVQMNRSSVKQILYVLSAKALIAMPLNFIQEPGRMDSFGSE